jgi:hypothetical protein
METMHLTFHIEREHSEVDWQTGAFVPRKGSQKTLLSMLCEVEVRKLRQGFLVEGVIDRGQFDIETLGEIIRAAVVDWVPKRRIWNLFTPTRIAVHIDDPGMPAYESEVAVSEDIATHFEEQARIGNSATEYLKKTLKELDEAVDDVVYYRQTISRGIGMLSQFSSASADGMMGAWRAEKLGLIRLGFESLGSRRNPNHPTYVRLVSDIRSYLGNWPTTNAWASPPPRPPS